MCTESECVNCHRMSQSVGGACEHCGEMVDFKKDDRVGYCDHCGELHKDGPCPLLASRGVSDGCV